MCVCVCVHASHKVNFEVARLKLKVRVKHSIHNFITKWELKTKTSLEMCRFRGGSWGILLLKGHPAPRRR